MARTDDDCWDLSTGVGTTATMIAAARAVASRDPNPVIHDAFAEVLVRAVGIELFTRIVDGKADFAELGSGWMPSVIGVRGRAFDDFATDACRAGIRQLVIVASGLDSRAYRLEWPVAMSIYEIDQPAVIAWKTNVLAELGCRSSARHRGVGIDLREDWPMALQQAGFNTAEPTAWIVEGLLVGYLPPDAHDEILDGIDRLSAAGSRVAADHFAPRPDAIAVTLDNFQELWSKHDPNLSLRSLTFCGAYGDPAVYLAERGWSTRNLDLDTLFRAAGQSAAAAEFPVEFESMRFLSGVSALVQ